MTLFSQSDFAAGMSARGGTSPGLLFIFMAAMLFGAGVFAIVRPNSQLFGGRAGSFFRRANQWQYANEDGPERSRAGLVFIRCIGCFFLVVSVGMLVSGLRSF